MQRVKLTVAQLASISRKHRAAIKLPGIATPAQEILTAIADTLSQLGRN